MKNQKGFSVVEGLLILVIVGLIGSVGWYVWQSKQKSDQKTNDVSQTQNQQDATTLVSSKGVTVASTSMPDGWTTQTCDENAVLVLPPTKPGVKCATEDHGFIAVNITDESNTDAPKDCDGASAKREEYKQYDWFVSYDCEAVTVDGRQGVKETTEQNEKAEFSGASTYIVYTFRLSNDVVVTADFTNARDVGKPEYTDIFNNFVKTLKFL